MKVLGLRASSSEIRYVILEETNDKVLFINQATENRLVFIFPM